MPRKPSAPRLRNDLFTADANGTIADCGQGGGFGLILESVTGGFPVSLVFDGDTKNALAVSGTYAVYLAEKFDALSIKGASAFAKYRVWVLVDPKEAVTGLRETVPGTVQLAQWNLADNQTGAANNIIWLNPDGTTLQQVAAVAAGGDESAGSAPIDCRLYRTVYLALRKVRTAAPSFAVGLESLDGPLAASGVASRLLTGRIAATGSKAALFMGADAVAATTTAGDIHNAGNFPDGNASIGGAEQTFFANVGYPPLFVRPFLAGSGGINVTYDGTVTPVVLTLWGVP